MSERRRALDGEWYTADEFKTYYGMEKAWSVWFEAGERSATEHSVERRMCLDGVAYTKDEMYQWYGQAADQIWNEKREKDAAHDWGTWLDASSDGDATAAEHGASSDAVEVRQSTVLLTVEDLQALRTSPHGNHKEARELLQKCAKDTEAETIDLTLVWEHWRAYIAKHKQSEEIVGPGVVSLKAERIPNSFDPNRFGAKRVDFFVHRIDGTAVRLHPGTTRANDAKIVVVPAKVVLNTLDELALIPQIDRVSCHDAFNRLVKHPIDDNDLTDGSRFPWPRFVANLGRLAPVVMGEGSISKVRLADIESDKVSLELTRSNATMVRLCLVKYEGKYAPWVGVHIEA